MKSPSDTAAAVKEGLFCLFISNYKLASESMTVQQSA